MECKKKAHCFTANVRENTLSGEVTLSIDVDQDMGFLTVVGTAHEHPGVQTSV